jgi:hypothetical protein
MQIKFRKGSWVLFFSVIIPFIATSVAASVDSSNLSGVNVTVYDNYSPFNEYNNAPPVPPTTPVAGSLVQSTIQNNFDYAPLFNLYDDFVVKYETNIFIEGGAEVYLYAPADDGVLLYVDDELVINDWYDKGGGGSMVGPIVFPANNSRKITMWYYENGGGAWVELLWLRNEQWQLIPSENLFLNEIIFTSETTTTTTTTIVVTTTLPPTTTIAPTTTTTTTTIPIPTTTTIPEVPVDPVVPEKPNLINEENLKEVIELILSGDVNIKDLVNGIDLSNIDKESVQQMIDAVIVSGITEEDALLLAVSSQILDSLTVDQASEIFQKINTGELTEAEKENLSTVLTEAKKEIKEQFEEKINVYSEGLNTYVPVGSNISVGSRRTLIAAATAMSSIGLAGGSSSSPSSQSKGSDGGGSGGPAWKRKRDDEENNDEIDVPEIEGPEGEDDSVFKKNSIFKYSEELMKKRFSPVGFIKKIWKITAAMAFTISGTTIVYFTLSGETRAITLVATGLAFVVHYINELFKNDQE